MAAFELMQKETAPGDGLPPAWQPITFRGVAAFAQARLGRLLIVQLIVAALVSGSLCWFLASVAFPTARAALHRLPETGAIVNGRLDVPVSTNQTLVENRFFAVIFHPDADTPISSLSDVRLELRQTNFALCSGGACWSRPYPSERVLPLNRAELEPAWGAWQPMFFAIAALGSFLWVLVLWLVLASLYFPIPWLVAYFTDRRLRGAGAWKLSAAALLPGALLTVMGLVLYGLGLIKLVQFTLLWAVHLPLGWVYLMCAPRRLPRVKEEASRPRDPFGGKPAETPKAAKSRSPFSAL